MAKSPPPQPSIADRRRRAREQQQRQAANVKRRRTIVQAGVIGGVALVVVAIVASAVILGNRGRGSTTPAADTTVTVNNVQVPFAVSGSAVRVGPADAKAKVDLWVDYSCPHCQEFEAENSEVLNQLIAGGDVSVSYHNIQIVTTYGTPRPAAPLPASRPTILASGPRSTPPCTPTTARPPTAGYRVSSAPSPNNRASTLRPWGASRLTATPAGSPATPPTRPPSRSRPHRRWSSTDRRPTS